jgi:hypothetical protein
MRLVRVSFVLSLVRSSIACVVPLVVFGCSGGGTTSSTQPQPSSDGGTASSAPDPACDQKSTCPNAEAMPEDARASCREMLAGRCRGVYLEVSDCTGANETCKDDGTTDVDAVRAACKSKFDDLATCLQADAERIGND